MPIRDRLYQKVFSSLFVYNILWEDSEVDERFLGLQEDSTVLGISAAGCGVAGMLSKHPRSIDAVDINYHHLALAALKSSAARNITSYADFYDLCARGRTPNSARTIQRLTMDMPDWIQRYWKRHHRRFNQPYHTHGLTGKVLTELRKRIGTDAVWLREVVHASIAERWQLVDEWIAPVLYQPHIRAFLHSPVQLLGLGINYEQRDRMLEAEDMTLMEFFIQHLKRVAATDLTRNWFAWYVLAGQFNHDREDAVPPYLRRDRHERALQSPTQTRWHHTNLFEVMRRAGPNTWSHYTLCDAPDWMPSPVQHKLLDEIERTARPGARIMVRTVEEQGMVELLNQQDRFRLLEDISEEASRLDMSRQYRRVSFYEVARA